MATNNTIQLKKSNVENKAPTSLEYGEIALNYHDGNFYYKNTSDQIAEFKRLDTRLNETDVSNMTYNVDGDLSEVLYVTGNKIVLSYTNGDLTSVDYYGVDSTTHLFTQTLNYDVDGNVQSTSWSVAP
jgi:hypothetical protein